jgi:hypothetical protein
MTLLTMYDSDNPATLPADALIVAGYVGSEYDAMVARFPHARHLSITGNAALAADCLDVENGDAIASEVVGWVRDRFAAGAYRPCVYASIDTNMPAVLQNLMWAKIPLLSVRLWVAHWGQSSAEIPSPFDALQYLNTSDYDENVLAANFFAPRPPKFPTLTDLQKSELGSMLQHLPTIRAQKGALTADEYGQVEEMYAHLGGILGK